MKLPLQFNLSKKNTEKTDENLSKEEIPTELPNLDSKVTEKIITDQKYKQKLPLFGLNADILWGGIAFGCILGVCLFWFQGVQPAMLTGFSNKTFVEIDLLEAKNTNQINSVIKSYNTVSERMLYSGANLCNVDQKYTQKNDDISFLESQETALLPASNLSKASSFNGFYISSVTDNYKTVYQAYSQKNQDYKKLITDVKSYPFYLEYRNNWIDSCVAIRQSQGNVGVIKQACTNLQTKTDEYEKNVNIAKPSIWEEAKPFVDKSTQTCAIALQSNAVTLANFGRWQLDMVSNYDLFMSIQPDFSSESDKLNVDAQNFSQSIKSLKEKVTFDLNEKKGAKSVYFMNFEW